MVVVYYCIDRGPDELEFIGQAKVEVGDAISQFGKPAQVFGEEIACADKGGEPHIAAIAAAGRTAVTALGAGIAAGVAEMIVGKHQSAIYIQVGRLHSRIMEGAPYTDDRIAPFFVIMVSDAIIKGIFVGFEAGIPAQADHPRSCIPQSAFVLQADGGRLGTIGVTGDGAPKPDTGADDIRSCGVGLGLYSNDREKE